ncbi:hypothetical protein ACIOWF_06895 [Cellulosimicrobium cellulans]|uniref:hypothetical protein n=1 Tax=Cellulosimicrobium cellulans TaxID=1710 RepID=UPI0037F1797A
MRTPAHAQTLPPPHVPGLVTREHPTRRTTKCAAPHTADDVECGLQVGHAGAHLARVDRRRRELDAPLVWTASPREWFRPDVWPSDAHRRVFAIADTTCGRWPDAICNDRRTWLRPTGGALVATCTRRPGHTGRHAHGDMGQIWAVWEKAPSVARRPRRVICEDMHATTHAVCTREAGHAGDHRAVGLDRGRLDATWSRPTADIQYAPSRGTR